MAITLQTIKQFLSDNANSMADTAASRTMDRIVQDALLLLGREHEWSFLRTRERFATTPPSTYSGVVNATQDSGSFVLSSGSWAAEEVSEKREIVIGTATDQPYTAASITTTTTPDDTLVATAGQEWIAASDTGLDATSYRPRYQLNNKIKKLCSAKILGTTRQHLKVVNRDEYEDMARLFSQTSGQVREVAVIDPTEVAIFPYPDQRYDVELEFVRKIEVPAEGAADATELDWPDEMVDLLRCAIRMQLIERLGDEAVPFDADLASARYQRLLNGYRREQGRRSVSSFAMRPGGIHYGDEVSLLRRPAT